jgi:hypothetical protein
LLTLVSEFSSFLISAATKSTNDRKNISNKPNYQKKRKKKKQSCEYLSEN